MVVVVVGGGWAKKAKSLGRAGNRDAVRRSAGIGREAQQAEKGGKLN